ncbi:PAS domain S-box protein [Ramlibacter aquaticus]|uniref:histidine kinase n=2 Tax=Ramlibacter TaxID=174951 RepID=A0ABR9SHC1_9BURK|nr:PAS domain S-box protein [Ramlibacter aquaticus]MBE7941753.1 PAS domain S-box protein [Ramlibacter aquaticus]
MTSPAVQQLEDAGPVPMAGATDPSATAGPAAGASAPLDTAGPSAAPAYPRLTPAASAPPALRAVHGLRSLKARMPLAVFVVVLACVGSMAWYADRLMHRGLEAELLMRQADSARVLAQEFDDEIRDRLSAVRLEAAGLPAELLERPAAAQAFLDARPALQTLFSGGLLLVDANGALVASTAAAHPTTALADQGHVRLALSEGKAGVSLQLDGGELPLMHFTAPVQGPRGHRVGVLVGDVDLRQPGLLDERDGNSRSGQHYVVDPGSRRVIAASNPAQVMAPLAPPGQLPALDGILQGRFEPVVFEQDRRPVLAAAARIPSTGWIALTYLPTAEIFAPVRTAALRLGSTAAVLALLIGLATWWVMRRELRPMLDASRRLSLDMLGGVDPQPLPIRRRDEMGQLFEVFNRMLARLADRDAALRDSEARYRAAFATSPDAVLISRLSDGHVTEVNPGFRWMTGWAPAEVLDRSTTDLQLFVDPQAQRQIRERVLRDGMVLNVETELRVKDGRVITVLISTQRGQLAGDDCLITTARDITDRKHSERAIARLGAAYAALSQCNAAIVRCTNSTQLFDQVCRDIVQLARMKLAWVGMVDPDDGLVHPVAWHGDGADYLAGLTVSVDATRPEGRGPTGTAVRENRSIWCQDFQHDPRTEAWHERGARFGWGASGSLPLMRNGEVVGGLTLYSGELGIFDAEMQRLFEQMAADISFALGLYEREAARQVAEAELRKLSLAVEQSPTGIVITDRDGEIEYVNRAYLRFTGYGREELIGRNPRMLQSGRTSSATYQGMWKALLEGQAWEGEIVNRRKDGREYIASQMIVPLRQTDGRVSHYVAVSEDVTERRRVALELERHRQQLEQLVASRTEELAGARRAADAASAAKSEFIGNLSREIRAPMHVIVGAVHLLRGRGADLSQLAWLDQVDNASQHLMTLFDDVLDLSRMESGRVELAQVNFRLPGLLEEVAALLEPQARARQLLVELDGRAAPLWLRGDRARLRQALFNYMGNAIKYTPSGSVGVRVTVEQERADALLLRFEVKDTGVGIPAERLPRLFMAMEEAQAGPHEHVKGTGLGLAINRRLARMMGGDVGVRSMPGLGSAFWFTAWLGRGLAEQGDVRSDGAGHADALLRERHPGARVLLVEDDAANAEVTVALLEQAGLRVSVARDGAEGLNRARDGGFDLALLAIGLAQMDGLEVARRLRAMPGWDRVPIVALSAYAEEQRACLEAGMDDFIGKPARPELLYAQVLHWLDAPRLPRDREPTAPPAPPLPGPARDDAEFLDRMAGVPGVDAARLQAWQGQAARFRQACADLLELHGQDAQKLGALVARGDARGAIRVAHGLRNAAGMVAVAQVVDAAREIEQALQQDGAAAATRLDAPLQAIAQALEQVALLLPTPRGTPGAG